MAISLSLGDTSLTTRSSIIIWPLDTSSRPAIILRAVDLPHPEGPTRTMNSPSLISRVAPLMTCTSLFFEPAFQSSHHFLPVAWLPWYTLLTSIIFTLAISILTRLLMNCVTLLFPGGNPCSSPGGVLVLYRQINTLHGNIPGE